MENEAETKRTEQVKAAVESGFEGLSRILGESLAKPEIAREVQISHSIRCALTGCWFGTPAEPMKRHHRCYWCGEQRSPDAKTRAMIDFLHDTAGSAPAAAD